MGLSFDMALLDTWLQDIIDLIDADGASGMVRFYDGVRPGSGDAPTGNLLAELDLAFPCGTVTTGVLTFDTIPSANALLDGDATWARIVSDADVFVVDGDVGLTADFVVNTITFTAGQPVTFTSFTLDALQNG